MFFGDLLKEHESFPKHHIAQYINTINAPKITEGLFFGCHRLFSENEFLQA